MALIIEKNVPMTDARKNEDSLIDWSSIEHGDSVVAKNSKQAQSIRSCLLNYQRRNPDKLVNFKVRTRKHGVEGSYSNNTCPVRVYFVDITLQNPVTDRHSQRDYADLLENIRHGYSVVFGSLKNAQSFMDFFDKEKLKNQASLGMIVSKKEILPNLTYRVHFIDQIKEVQERLTHKR